MAVFKGTATHTIFFPPPNVDDKSKHVMVRVPFLTKADFENGRAYVSSTFFDAGSLTCKFWSEGLVTVHIDHPGHGLKSTEITLTVIVKVNEDGTPVPKVKDDIVTTSLVDDGILTLAEYYGLLKRGSNNG